ncbi:hypothetical protein [Mycolicibacterium poriferae]|jgi:hypothetical protein|uniref:hypothetical protein n=1 Tax=Mycolicibacterium poriferae TaxID=39694 RepID=UPI0024BA207E|nr:hypothetical protein [Mycolicibacterium poriferae]
MALNTTPPPDLKSTDSLKDIPRDLLGPVPRELRLGSNTLLVLENPPELGETVDVVLRIRNVREGKEKANSDIDGEVTFFCAGKTVTAWLLGQPTPPKEDDDQGALIDEDGNIPEDDEGEPGESDGVDRPGFSDGAK